VIGGGGNDSLSGGVGNDSFFGSGGNDTIDGGTGFDTAGYSALSQSVQVQAINSNTFALGINGSTKDERLVNIEALIGGSGDDLFDMELVSATSVNLSLVGNAGNDTFKSGKGSDTLSGGADNDLYYVNDSTDLIIEDAAGGFDRVYMSGTSFNLATNGANVEELYHRVYKYGVYETSDFTGIGNALDNLIAGGTGNDSLVGGGGDDTFRWTGGNDVIDGEGGNDGGTAGTSNLVDFSYIGTKSNVLDLSSSNRIEAEQKSEQGWLVKILNLAGTVINSVSMSNITGLWGSNGNDLFKLGEGNKGLTIDGKGGTDTIDYANLGSGTSVSLNLATGSAVLKGTSKRTDTFASISNASGGKGNDLLRLDWSSINLSKLDAGSGTDTVSFANSTNDITLSGSSFSNLLSNAEYIDFSGTSGTVSLSLGGDDVQKLLTGSSSSSSYAGVLDLKFDASGDSLSLLNNGSYSYWNSSDVNATAGKFNDGTNFSISGSTQQYVYVFDTNHTTLLATLYLHT
jgi:hypothetical protein